MLTRVFQALFVQSGKHLGTWSHRKSSEFCKKTGLIKSNDRFLPHIILAGKKKIHKYKKTRINKNNRHNCGYASFLITPCCNAERNHRVSRLVSSSLMSFLHMVDGSQFIPPETDVERGGGRLQLCQSVWAKFGGGGCRFLEVFCPSAATTLLLL